MWCSDACRSVCKWDEVINVYLKRWSRDYQQSLYTGAATIMSFEPCKSRGQEPQKEWSDQAQFSSKPNYTILTLTPTYTWGHGVKPNLDPICKHIHRWHIQKSLPLTSGGNLSLPFLVVVKYFESDIFALQQQPTQMSQTNTWQTRRRKKFQFLNHNMITCITS